MELLNHGAIAAALITEDFEPFRAAAVETRNSTRGTTVTLRAIIEYSNRCKRTCKYCGLNARNIALERYRMTEDEITETAEQAVKAGYRSIVLQGGEDDYYDTDRMSSIIERIARLGVLITLSSGELPDNQYKRYYAAGARRYLLKHETANAKLYARLHGEGALESRIDRLMSLKRIGYDIGSGFMIGLPGQTMDDIADDIELCARLDADMVGIGTFIPHEGTVLADKKSGSADLTLRAVALTRLIMPDINIPSTTSLGVAGNDAYIALDYGADVIMRKVTPSKYRKLYQIYSAPAHETDIAAERNEIIMAIGRKGYTAI